MSKQKIGQCLWLSCRYPASWKEHWILRLPERPAAAPEKRVVEEFEDSEGLMPLI